MSTDKTNPRYRSLAGAQLYETTGTSVGQSVLTSTAYAGPSGDVPKWSNWVTTVGDGLDGLFGDDYVAGGAGNDQIFGQSGADAIQGDGSTASKVAAGGTPVSAKRDATTAGLLFVAASFEASGDGDDYIEGNAGNDTIFGNLGQDDIIGGSSNLFGLLSAAQRGDGSDLIFGGAGTDIARNDLGDTSQTGHARDADAILGDNGTIFRIVGTGGAANATQTTNFNYDGYNGGTGSLNKIAVRSIMQLEYTPGSIIVGGPTTDIGAADEIHGESGDDFIYGMKGGDVIFGEGQDDDIVGGYGNDWISGGTGDDGVIGDDGRIFTSRNGLTEALNAVTVAVVPATVATGGSVQTADINVAGQLKKAVDITPFSQDTLWSPVADEFSGITAPPHTSDDVVFGGLGNDFLHGGSGDDAISGAEALAQSYAPSAFDTLTGAVLSLIQIDYNHPVNPGNVLAFNAIDVNAAHNNRQRAGEFALYDEYNPLKKITLTAGAVSAGEYFLNFVSTEGPLSSNLTNKKNTDGDDKIFGDLGNDWLVGGSGRDNIYGGFGNDLLNADDDLGTLNGLNNGPDVNDGSYEDRAFGGAGRDVLIANTGGDRLIDWTGEYNSYLVRSRPSATLPSAARFNLRCRSSSTRCRAATVRTSRVPPTCLAALPRAMASPGVSLAWCCRRTQRGATSMVAPPTRSRATPTPSATCCARPTSPAARPRASARRSAASRSPTTATRWRRRRPSATRSACSTSPTPRFPSSSRCRR